MKTEVIIRTDEDSLTLVYSDLSPQFIARAIESAMRRQLGRISKTEIEKHARRFVVNLLLREGGFRTIPLETYDTEEAWLPRVLDILTQINGRPISADMARKHIAKQAEREIARRKTLFSLGSAFSKLPI